MAKSHEEPVGIEMFCILIGAVFSQVHRVDQTHYIVYFKKRCI